MNVIALDQLPAQVARQAPTPALGGAIGLRPEGVSLCAPEQSALMGCIDLVESLGAETLVYASTPTGAQFVARQNERLPLRAGDSVGLAIDTAQAHWFDPSGRVVRAAS